MAAKAKEAAPKQVDPALRDAALAAAVASGDIVNFRLLFGSFSPGRIESPERFEDAKYAYLQPSEELCQNPAYAEAVRIIESPPVREHIECELAAQRPAQLPSELLLPLADNAVRAGKFTSAAQTYELLRIRRRMQELFYAEAESALDTSDLQNGVRAIRIAAALDYDYAGFPEPMPKVPEYQKRALIVHGRYPATPQQSVPLMAENDLIDALIGFLVNDTDAVARLRKREQTLRVEVAAELVRQIDPEWDAFVARYAEACALTRSIGQALARKDRNSSRQSLAEEIAELDSETPASVMATLLGRTIDGGAWWTYLKEIAVAHPAGIFFISRQLVADDEVILPRYRADSLLAEALGIAQAGSGPAEVEAAPSSSDVVN